VKIKEPVRVSLKSIYKTSKWFFMRRIFTLLIILFFLGPKGFSQACTVLGCASNAATFGIQTGNSAQLDNPTPGLLGGCYGGAATFKQVFWEFFLSPGGGDLVQSIDPSGVTNNLDLDFALWDMGTTAPNPSTLNCSADPNTPLDVSGWSQVACNSESTGDLPTGPGVGPGPGGNPNVVPTVAGHYYALGIIFTASTGGPFTFTVGTASLGGTPMNASNCFDITLPLKLSSFGARVNNCAVNLNWVSESETDFKNYEVESSATGDNFKTVATITPSQASTGSSQKYSYVDKNPTQGKVYYRLKMIDIDGSFSYSNTIALRLDCNKNLVLVYPNPVSDVLNVNVTNSNENSTNANLYDSDGRLVLAKKLLSGTNLIDMKKFPSGLYLLELNSNGEKQHFKIIK